RALRPARGGDLRGPARARGRPGAPHPGLLARGGRAGYAGRAGRGLLRHNYVKPRLTTGDELFFVEGRHPVMERVLDDPFVANDLRMGEDAPRLFILTGPNMGGKSTYLRQTALMVRMAQMGCFVPAREAKLGL